MQLSLNRTLSVVSGGLMLIVQLAAGVVWM